MTFTHALATNNYGTAKFIVATSAANGTHTTLTAAMAVASSGDTIFLRDTVTENVTLTPGVNIASWNGDLINTPAIIGKLTMTGVGTSTISGIKLQTNGDNFLAITGSANSVVNLRNCYLNCSNATGIVCSSSGVGSGFGISHCRGDIGTTGISLFDQSGAGGMNMQYTTITTSGNSLTASTISSGTGTFLHSNINFGITTSSTGALGFYNCYLDVNSLNITGLTTNGSGTTIVYGSEILSGTASAISIGVSCSMTISQCVIASTNTNAITGAGAISYCGLSYSNSSSTINTTTQTLLVNGPSGRFAGTKSGGQIDLSVSNQSNTATSDAALRAIVAGSSGGDAQTTYIVNAVSSWGIGLDNSDSDAFAIANGAVLGTTNIMRAASTGEINFPLQSAFFATANLQSDVTGDNTAYTILYANEIFDQNSDFASPTFTAPVTGRYHLSFVTDMIQLGAAHTVGYSKMITSNRTINCFISNYGAIRDGNTELAVGSSMLVDMDAADTATITLTIFNGTKVVDVQANNTCFSGYLEC